MTRDEVFDACGRWIDACRVLPGIRPGMAISLAGNLAMHLENGGTVPQWMDRLKDSTRSGVVK